ncbi:NADPH-dependent oxidoreductase [Gluconobacter albidus]|uniref:NADPH-dependent oxidoreductase n=1 Tax=Gluconobacter albidus TaxID=318683 RepID=A0AAW3QUZ5_9PROT|nr:NADPH-dependent oxidoreductase [Gluconobacter albidus]KXV37347.1 nitroreductase [Gluconobacter albidus]GBQ85374.1 nitroreductase [Gluconobacter albidus NBRC 3250]GLQ68692.1 NADPH-dependent oxidoreductase [Gluconobacter albidus]
MSGTSSERISALWQTRYRTPAPETLPDNAVLDLLLSHHSVRAYLPDALPEGTLEAGIAAASSAATSSNLQVWSVVAVENPETRARLAELCGGQKHIEVAPLFLAWIVDLSRLERIANLAGTGHEALDYEEIFLMATLDTGIAAQNAVTAFESLGLGTVYIGGLRNHPEEVARLLSLPPRSVAVVGLCVGQPDPAAQNGHKPRLGQDVVLHRERYSTETEAEGIAVYDRVADDYQKEQGLSSRAWSETVASRVDSFKGLSGRHVMRTVLHKLGFSLR